MYHRRRHISTCNICLFMCISHEIYPPSPPPSLLPPLRIFRLPFFVLHRCVNSTWNYILFFVAPSMWWKWAYIMWHMQAAPFFPPVPYEHTPNPLISVLKKVTFYSENIFFFFSSFSIRIRRAFSSISFRTYMYSHPHLPPLLLIPNLHHQPKLPYSEEM